MIKLAIPDPVQKALRDAKKAWNAEARVLISQLIAFKRGLNGRGDPQAGLPPSDIKHPLPNEVQTYLNDMVNRYQNVVSGAEEIIRMQEEYSKTRRKSRKELEESGIIPSEQQSIAAEEFEIDNIIKNASNTLSRTWTTLTQYPIFKKNEFAKQRIKFLYSFAEFEEKVNEVELVLTSLDKHAIYTAFYQYKFLMKLIYFNFIKRLDVLIKVVSEQFKDNPNNLKSPSEENKSNQEDVIEIKEQINEFDAIKNLILEIKKDNLQVFGLLNKIKEKITKEVFNLLAESSKKVDKLSTSAIMVIKESNDVNDLVKDSFSKLNEAYKELLDLAKNITSLDGKTIEELSSKISTANINNTIIKFSKYDLKRYLNRLKLKLLFNEEYKSRLDIANDLSFLSAEIDDFENILENSNISLEHILSYVSVLCKKIADISIKFIKVAEMYNDQYSIERAELERDRKDPLVQIPKFDINEMQKYSDLYTSLQSKYDSSGEKNGPSSIKE
jgi:hypothetical protein